MFEGKSDSTDAIRVRKPWESGVHVWSLTWLPESRGSSASVGVGKMNASLHSDGYHSLIGSNGNSWGWDIVDNQLRHGGKVVGKYPEDAGYDYKVPETFRIVLDMDAGTLAFATEEKFLGVAFRGLKGKVLYVMIGMLYGDSRVTLKYEASTVPYPYIGIY
jgi:SPRY domain-containing SOCS box protein 1/4